MESKTLTLSASQVRRLMQGPLVIVRPVKPQPKEICWEGHEPLLVWQAKGSVTHNGVKGISRYANSKEVDWPNSLLKFSPTGPVGTVAGVREAYYYAVARWNDDDDNLPRFHADKYCYEATGHHADCRNHEHRWIPGQHMTSQAIRLHARKTAMRVCRQSQVTMEELGLMGIDTIAWNRKYRRLDLTKDLHVWVETWELEAQS